MEISLNKIILIAAILAVVQADQIDSILYQKIKNSTPNVSDASVNTYLSTITKSGKRFALTIPVSQLAGKVNENFPVSVGGTTQNVKPWNSFQALRWGSKLEHLESNKLIKADGTWSWGILSAKVGVRQGDNLTMRSVVGWVQGKSKQMYQKISYQSCKRKLFHKKCHTATKDVPRGLTVQEVSIVQQGILKNAHQGALDNSPSSLFADQDESTDIDMMDLSMVGSNITGTILYDVTSQELKSAISALVHGTETPQLVQKIEGYSKAPVSGTIIHNNTRIELSWNGRNFTITAQN